MNDDGGSRWHTILNNISVYVENIITELVVT